jgi:hypothetical protein
MFTAKMFRRSVPVLVLVAPWVCFGAEANLPPQCKRAWNEHMEPMCQSAVDSCVTRPEEERPNCVSRELASIAVTYDSVMEFAVLFANVLRGTSSQDATEYFKERLYYLAIRLEPEDIPEPWKDFDFGPVGAIPHDGTKMYEHAMAKHHPRVHPLIRARNEQGARDAEAIPAR